MHLKNTITPSCPQGRHFQSGDDALGRVWVQLLKKIIVHVDVELVAVFGIPWMMIQLSLLMLRGVALPPTGKI